MCDWWRLRIRVRPRSDGNMHTRGTRPLPNVFWYMHGRACTPSDFFGEDAQKLLPGDLGWVHTHVCTRMQGAYAAQMDHGALTQALPASVGRCIRAYVSSLFFPLWRERCCAPSGSGESVHSLFSSKGKYECIQKRMQRTTSLLTGRKRVSGVYAARMQHVCSVCRREDALQCLHQAPGGKGPQ